MVHIVYGIADTWYVTFIKCFFIFSSVMWCWPSITSSQHFHSSPKRKSVCERENVLKMNAIVSRVGWWWSSSEQWNIEPNAISVFCFYSLHSPFHSIQSCVCWHRTTHWFCRCALCALPFTRMKFNKPTNSSPPAPHTKTINKLTANWLFRFHSVLTRDRKWWRTGRMGK